MASARYWRLSGLEPYGSDTLTLSEVQLWASGVRIDTVATVTATIPPSVGTLANLVDNNLSTSASWPRTDSTAPSFGISWDIGSTLAVDRVYLGSASTKGSFPYGFTISTSSDGIAWTPIGRADTITFPGVNAAVLVGVLSLMPLTASIQNGRDGSAVVSEQTGRPVTLAGAAALSPSTVSEFGTRALSLPSANSYLSLPNSVDFALGDGDFDFETEVVLTAYPVNNAGLFRSALVTKDVQGSRSFSWELDGTTGSLTSMRLTLFNAGGGDATVSVPYAFLLNTRYFLRVSRVSGSVVFFINGTKIGAAQSLTTTVPQGSAPVAVGQTLFNATYFYQLFGYVGRTYLSVGLALDQADYTDATSPFAGRTGMDQQSPMTRPVDATRFVNSPIPAFGGGRDLGTFARVRNFETDGNGVISGTVAILGDPTNTLVRRRVRLLRDKDAVLVAEVWSNATTGAFSFPAIDRTQKYIVLTDDYEASYRAVVADRITPELMP